MRKSHLVILPGARSITQVGALLLFLACPNIAFVGRDRSDIMPSCSVSTMGLKWLQKKPEFEKLNCGIIADGKWVTTGFELDTSDCLKDRCNNETVLPKNIFLKQQTPDVELRQKTVRRSSFHTSVHSERRSSLARETRSLERRHSKEQIRNIPSDRASQRFEGERRSYSLDRRSARLIRSINIHEDRRLSVRRGVRAATRDVRVATVDARVASRDVRVATRDVRVDNRDVQAATRDVRTATRDVRAATRDVRVATRDVRVATRDVRVDNRDVRAATRDVQAATRDVRAATRDVRAATRDVRAATGDVQVATRDVRAATRDVRAATRDVRAATRDVRAATRDIRADTRDVREANRYVRADNRDIRTVSQHRRYSLNELKPVLADQSIRRYQSRDARGNSQMRFAQDWRESKNEVRRVRRISPDQRVNRFESVANRNSEQLSKIVRENKERRLQDQNKIPSTERLDSGTNKKNEKHNRFIREERRIIAPEKHESKVYRLSTSIRRDSRSEMRENSPLERDLIRNLDAKTSLRRESPSEQRVSRISRLTTSFRRDTIREKREASPTENDSIRNRNARTSVRRDTSRTSATERQALKEVRNNNLQYSRKVTDQLRLVTSQRLLSKNTRSSSAEERRESRVELRYSSLDRRNDDKIRSTERRNLRSVRQSSEKHLTSRVIRNDNFQNRRASISITERQDVRRQFSSNKREVKVESRSVLYERQDSSINRIEGRENVRSYAPSGRRSSMMSRQQREEIRTLTTETRDSRNDETRRGIRNEERHIPLDRRALRITRSLPSQERREPISFRSNSLDRRSLRAIVSSTAAEKRNLRVLMRSESPIEKQNVINIRRERMQESRDARNEKRQSPIDGRDHRQFERESSLVRRYSREDTLSVSRNRQMSRSVRNDRLTQKVRDSTRFVSLDRRSSRTVRSSEDSRRGIVHKMYSDKNRNAKNINDEMRHLTLERRDFQKEQRQNTQLRRDNEESLSSISLNKRTSRNVLSNQLRENTRREVQRLNNDKYRLLDVRAHSLSESRIKESNQERSVDQRNSNLNRRINYLERKDSRDARSSSSERRTFMKVSTHTIQRANNYNVLQNSRRIRSDIYHESRDSRIDSPERMDSRMIQRLTVTNNMNLNRVGRNSNERSMTLFRDQFERKVSRRTRSIDTPERRNVRDHSRAATNTRLGSILINRVSSYSRDVRGIQLPLDKQVSKVNRDTSLQRREEKDKTVSSVMRSSRGREDARREYLQRVVSRPLTTVQSRILSNEKRLNLQSIAGVEREVQSERRYDGIASSRFSINELPTKKKSTYVGSLSTSMANVLLVILCSILYPTMEKLKTNLIGHKESHFEYQKSRTSTLSTIGSMLPVF